MFDYNPFREFKEMMEEKRAGRGANADERDLSHNEITRILMTGRGAPPPTSRDNSALNSPINIEGLPSRPHPVVPHQDKDEASLDPRVADRAERIKNALFTQSNPEEYQYGKRGEGEETTDIMWVAGHIGKNLERHIKTITGETYDPGHPVHPLLLQVGVDHIMNSEDDTLDEPGLYKQAFDLMKTHYNDPKSHVHKHAGEWDATIPNRKPEKPKIPQVKNEAHGLEILGSHHRKLTGEEPNPELIQRVWNGAKQVHDNLKLFAPRYKGYDSGTVDYGEITRRAIKHLESLSPR